MHMMCSKSWNYGWRVKNAYNVFWILKLWLKSVECIWCVLNLDLWLKSKEWIWCVLNLETMTEEYRMHMMCSESWNYGWRVKNAYDVFWILKLWLKSEECIWCVLNLETMAEEYRMHMMCSESWNYGWRV